jgi:hypothetical protein
MVIQEYFIGIIAWVMSLVIVLLFDEILLIKHDKGIGFRWAREGNLVPNQKMDKVVWFRFLELILLGVLMFPIRWIIGGVFRINHWIYYLPILMLFLPAAYLIIIKTLPNHPYEIKVRHWVWSGIIWFLAFALMFLFGYLNW